MRSHLPTATLAYIYVSICEYVDYIRDSMGGDMRRLGTGIVWRVGAYRIDCKKEFGSCGIWSDKLLI